MVVLLAQAPAPNGAHDALDSLDDLRAPTQATLTLIQSDQAVAAGFEPGQNALARAGVVDGALRIGALSLSSLAMLTASSVITSLSPDSLLVGALGGVITAGLNALLYFLWVQRGGADLWRALELHNDTLLARARTQSTDPVVDAATNRLLLVGISASATVKQGGRTLGDDEVAQLFSERVELAARYREAQQLRGLSTILKVASFVVLGLTPLTVGALRPPLATVLGLNFGGFLAAAGAMTAGLLVGSHANDTEVQALDTWNREVLAKARARLPLRVPEPDPLPVEPEPRREEPPPLQPPTSDVPVKRLLLPGLTPSTP